MGWWTRGKTIGRGSSATVYLATATVSGELLAVKSTELSSSALLQKEQSLVSQISPGSPYMIKYIGSEITSENGKSFYNLLMEYIPGGTLSDLIKKQKEDGGSLNESIIQLYAHQILKGLEFLHLNGIVHCDIKGQNILIGEDGIKIADFGCARKVEKDQKSISGTPIFMAPEVARGEEQGFAADIWALGCTIIEMATGASPWPEISDPVSALYRIGYSGDVPEFPGWLSRNANEFLDKCLRIDVNERWTAKELLEHPFFNGIGTNNSREEITKIVRNSPTSILDQDFWDSSMEACELAQESYLFSSSRDRIKNLIEDDVSKNLPNWTEDEDWMTVRGIVEEENPQVFEKIHEVEVQDYEDSMSEEEELESSINIENLLLNSFLDVEIDNSGNVVSTTIDHVMYSDIVEYAIALRILDSEIKIRTSFAANHFQTFHKLLHFFFLNSVTAWIQIFFNRI